MKIEEWLPIYDSIAEAFSFSKKKDYASAVVLNKIVNPIDVSKISRMIRGKEINIFGAGPSLEDIKKIPRGFNITADGATSYLLDNGAVPDIVVTDLDGRIDDLINANQMGAIVFLHAHGDNVTSIKRYAEDFDRDKLYGTTQNRPFGKLLNYGGFTDGDRAVFIAETHSPSRITLYGMDFDAEPGKYSFTPQNKIPRKKRKLRWAKKLIGDLIKTSKTDIVFG